MKIKIYTGVQFDETPVFVSSTAQGAIDQVLEYLNEYKGGGYSRDVEVEVHVVDISNCEEVK